MAEKHIAGLDRMRAARINENQAAIGVNRLEDPLELPRRGLDLDWRANPGCKA